jgi:hypothetical protein
MNLTAPGLRLTLTPLSGANAEDWAQLHVLASVNGFDANFKAFIQSADVEHFAHSLAQLQEALKPGTRARLASAEPGISLELEMRTLGQIGGHYQFQSEVREEGATALSGGFELDQSYLPTLLADARSLLEQLRTRNAA